MSEPLFEALVLSLLAGLAIPLGAAGAMIPRWLPGWLETSFRHFVVAFGGGALLSAVALVLLPEGIELLSPTATVTAFVLGGCCFFMADAAIGRSGRTYGQLLAMLLDFVPEAIAMGAAFAHGAHTGPLLAFLIAVQNLPEGFNAYREVAATASQNKLRLLGSFMALALAGPTAAALGWFVFAELPHALGAMMVFCSGGILYLCFQDIAPQAKLERHWGPPLGAVAGFSLGLVGHLLTLS